MKLGWHIGTKRAPYPDIPWAPKSCLPPQRKGFLTTKVVTPSPAQAQSPCYPFPGAQKNQPQVSLSTSQPLCLALFPQEGAQSAPQIVGHWLCKGVKRHTLPEGVEKSQAAQKGSSTQTFLLQWRKAIREGKASRRCGSLLFTNLHPMGKEVNSIPQSWAWRELSKKEGSGLHRFSEVKNHHLLFLSSPTPPQSLPRQGLA